MSSKRFLFKIELKSLDKGWHTLYMTKTYPEEPVELLTKVLPDGFKVSPRLEEKVICDFDTFIKENLIFTCKEIDDEPESESEEKATHEE